MCGYKGTHSGVYLKTANLGLKRMTVINYPLCESATLHILSSLSQALSKDYVISVFLKVSHLRKKWWGGVAAKWNSGNISLSKIKTVSILIKFLLQEYQFLNSKRQDKVSGILHSDDSTNKTFSLFLLFCRVSCIIRVRGRLLGRNAVLSEKSLQQPLSKNKNEGSGRRPL